jgi:hypothetical protein
MKNFFCKCLHECYFDNYSKDSNFKVEIKFKVALIIQFVVFWAVTPGSVGSG